MMVHGLAVGFAKAIIKLFSSYICSTTSLRRLSISVIDHSEHTKILLNDNKQLRFDVASSDLESTCSGEDLHVSYYNKNVFDTKSHFLL